MSGLAQAMGIPTGNLGEAVLDFAVEVTVTRFERSPREKGRSPSEPASTTFEALVSVQPLNQKERNQLPEGTRADGRVKGYTPTELRTVETAQSKIADHFCYKGINYVVDRVDDWDDLGGYFRIEAERLDR